MNKGIVLGIAFLFVVMSFASISGIQINNQIIKPLDRGNILYVGGSGPGNYTSIQDAINDSNSGDTVFVFDDSSPYYENVIVDKSISLIGEDRNTTFIDGDLKTSVIEVISENVIIDSFTIQNGGGEFPGSGIEIRDSSNYNAILNSNIYYNQDGIFIPGNAGKAHSNYIFNND